jgi:hypothetical protein
MGQYDNPIPTRLLAPIDCYKIPAQPFLLSLGLGLLPLPSKRFSSIESGKTERGKGGGVIVSLSQLTREEGGKIQIRRQQKLWVSSHIHIFALRSYTMSY